MADIITFTTSRPDIISCTPSDVYGGKTYNLSSGYQLEEMIKWYQEYKDQLMKESKAREKFESVASAYEQYQTVLKLVLDQV